jgi:predicted TIM-barrel fold metal-dependent hydrolase
MIDVFVHPAAGDGMRSLAPYLPSAWRERFEGLGGLEKPLFRGAAVDDLPVADSVVLVPRESINAWPDPALTATVLRAANDYFLAEWLPRDPRLRYALLVCGQDIAWSVEEVRRRAGERAVAAVALAPMHTLMGDPQYQPLYAACADARLPVIVHPTGAEGLYVGAPQPAAGAGLNAAERDAVLPQIAQANILSLVFSGTLARHPELRVVFAGFGFSWLTPLLWRMDMDWRRTRVETPWVDRLPAEVVRGQIRLATAGADAPRDDAELRDLLDMSMAADVLVHGSGSPGPGAASALLERLDDELRERVARTTAQRSFPRLSELEVTL